MTNIATKENELKSLLNFRNKSKSILEQKMQNFSPEVLQNFINEITTEYIDEDFNTVE